MINRSKLQKDFCTNDGDTLSNLTVNIKVLEFIDPCYIDGVNVNGPFPTDTPLTARLEGYASKDKLGSETEFFAELTEDWTMTETGWPMTFAREATCGMANGSLELPVKALPAIPSGVTI